jgi:hypothetical protein
MNRRFALMKTVLAILIVLASGTTPGAGQAAETYRYVDERGNVVYTDTWRPGAQRVEPAPGGVIPAPDAVKRGAAAAREAAGQPAAYDRVEISAPGPDETVWDDGEGHLDVAVSVSPAIKAGHRIRALLDGSPRDGLSGDGTVRLSDMERGTYTLQIEVVDGAGRTLGASNPVVFHYKKPSKLAPKGPDIYPRPTPLTPGAGKP